MSNGDLTPSSEPEKLAREYRQTYWKLLRIPLAQIRHRFPNAYSMSYEFGGY